MRQKNIAKPIFADFKQVASKTVGGFVTPLKTNKRVKSPLRYPGGKYRAVNQILDFLPQELDTLCSPFLGGGSVELACASEFGVKVYGYDAFEPVVSFWQELIKNPLELVKLVREHYPLSRTKFYSLQKRLTSLKNKQELAATFFILNRSSFSGTTMSGGMSPGHQRFNENAIKRLETFKIKGFSVKQADFKKSIPKHDNDFLYLDPPYANGGNLYGTKGDHHTNFDHKALSEILKNRDGWLLSYNDSEIVRDLYSGFKILTPSWTYGMSSDKKSSEVLILSRDYVRCQ